MTTGAGDGWGIVMAKLVASGAGLLAAVLLVGPSLAADIRATPKRERAAQPQRAPQQQASNWSGGQAGGSNGASSVNNNFVEPGAYNFYDCFEFCQETPFSFSGSKTSYIVGAFLGWRWQFGSMVAGVEGDVYWKKGETALVQHTDTSAFPVFDYLCCETFTGSLKQGWDGSFRGRFGVLVTPWTLLYGTAGLAIGQISGSFSYYAESLSGVVVSGAASWTETRLGGTVGVGAETELLYGIKGRVEYRYTDFGKFTRDVPLAASVSCSPSDCGTNAHIEMRASNHRVTVGLGFDFSPPPPPIP
jgi:outer membrane immunogenic protein